MEDKEDVRQHNFQSTVDQGNEINNEDGSIAGNVVGNFNINSGLWSYEALSKHIP